MPATETATPVPGALRTWFVVHFVADLAVAAPLFIAPGPVLRALGWAEVDPLATRLVAAALAGIGVQSLLGRNDSAEVFRAMLSLKVIWSACATVGILVTQLQGGPTMGWVFMGVFAGFHLVWLRYHRLLRRAR